MSSKKLGEILIEKGVITQAQLSEALSLQKQSKQFLGKIMIAKKMASEWQVLTALAEQFEVPLMKLEPAKVDFAAGEQYSIAFLQEQICIPIFQDEQTIRVAISNPLNAWAISEIEARARGRNLELILATEANILELVKELGKRTLLKKGTPPKPGA